MEGSEKVIIFSSCCHIDADARLFCRTCKVHICDDCIISRDHADHSLEKMQSAREHIQEELRGRLTTATNTISQQENNIKECRSQKLIYEDRVKKIIKQVTDNFERSMKNLKDEKDSFLSELDTISKGNLAIYDERETQMIQVVSKWTEFQKQARKYVEDPDTLGALREIIMPSITNSDVPIVPLPTLLCDEISKEVVRKAIGVLKITRLSDRKLSVFESASPLTLSSEEVSVVARDRYLTTGITAICPVGHTAAWVTRANNVGCIDLVSFTSARISVEKTLEIDKNRVDDLIINNSGDLLIVVRNSPIIRALRHGRKSSTIFTDVSPYIPFGLCVTKSDHVLVCAAKVLEDGTFKGTILDLNEAGKLVRHLNIKDNTGAIIQLHLPRKVREMTNNQVVILECVDLTDPKIFIVTPDGETLQVINGRDANFACVGICCDLSNRLVIADRKSNALIFVDESADSELERHDVDKLYDPWCLAPSMDGRIWIGCGNSYVMIVSTKQHVSEESTYSNVFM